MLDNSNVTTNSRWHLAHSIRQAVASMDEFQRAQCLETIQARVTLSGQSHDPNTLKYVVDLLKGKTPRKGVSK